MLAVYQDAKFVVPENPVMRGVAPPNGMQGLAAYVKALYAVPENSVLRGAGIGRLGCAGCTGYPDCDGPMSGGYAPMGGLGDMSTFLSNLSTGNFTDALSGQDIVSGFPNFIIVPIGLWVLFSLVGDTKRSYKAVKGYSKKRSARAKRLASARKTLEEDGGLF
jgi:hypothetical protein